MLNMNRSAFLGPILIILGIFMFLKGDSTSIPVPFLSTSGQPCLSYPWAYFSTGYTSSSCSGGVLACLSQEALF